MSSIDCKEFKLQLGDKELVIADATRKALKELTPDQCRHAILCIRSFFQMTVSYLQQRLPLGNQLLRQLGCLNPSKRKENSTVSSIQSLASVLQPKVSKTEVVDEWKIFPVDPDLPSYDAKERIEVFWRKVFALQSHAGDFRYKALPVVVKSALVLGQTNALSEQNLSVNERIVTQDRASLDEKTIVGLHEVKDAVRFFDPLTNQPELIPVEPNLKESCQVSTCCLQGVFRETENIRRE